MTTNQITSFTFIFVAFSFQLFYSAFSQGCETKSVKTGFRF